MKIHIHRGQYQIGGSIIEISTDSTRIILDAGITLDEGETVTVPQIDGLFAGKKKYDGIFISHYHSDHIGLLQYIVDGIPVWMGEKSFDIIHSSNDYRKLPTSFTPNYIHDREPVVIGNITVTPFLCDHSAYDSYMLLLEGEGQKILYTGDFRANGRLDYDDLLNSLPKVDAVIIEGTTLSRSDGVRNIEEQKLEDIAVQYLSKHKGPCFVLMSSMNVDRLITIANAAKRTGRILLENVYTAGIAEASGVKEIMPNKSDNVRVFQIDQSEHDLLLQYGDAKIGKNEFPDISFIMCIRQSRLMRKYLDLRSKEFSFEDGVLFYGMWKGYQEKKEMADFLEFMQDRGVNIHTLHTSGHADSETIDKLIQHIAPKIIIPVHTENADWFNRYANVCSIINDRSEVSI